MFFEQTNKPWFGPRKRAFDFLFKNRTALLSPRSSINLIFSSLAIEQKDVNHLKFYDFIDNKSGFRYSIVIIQTISSPIVREYVYKNALLCVQACGWYPLVQGERLRSSNIRNIKVKSTLDLNFELFEIIGYENACKDGEGTSIRILFKNGSILFDSGLPNKLKFKDSDKLCLISHSHSDHSGGIHEILKKGVQVILNKETYLILCSKSILNEFTIYENLHIISSDATINLINSTIKAFSVPHCFGSIAYLLEFQNLEIIFTGDIVLKSKRFEYINYIISLYGQINSKRYIFLDSTMCMRADGVSQQDAPENLVKILKEFNEKQFVIVSRDKEQLIYALIDIFFYTKELTRNEFSFIFDRETKKTASIIHENFIKSKYDQIDKILFGQYGMSKSAWGESRWIYWIKFYDEIIEISKYNQPIIFLTEDQLYKYPQLKESNYLYIGKQSESVYQFFMKKSIDFDSTPWTMHSNSDVLKESILYFNSKGITSILFHDFVKRMNKFIAEFDFQVNLLNQEIESFRSK
jgi:hypothetical protein